MQKRENVFKAKFWGNEIWFENNNLYCGKIITCHKNIWSSKGLFHYHKEKDETFFVIEGSLLIHMINVRNPKLLDAVKLDPGMSYRIKPGVKHRFTSKTEICKFIEVSTTHHEEDSYRVEVKEFDLGY